MTCASCNDDPFYPGGQKCTLTAAGVNTGWTVCKDGYNDGTGKCVTNCGVGKYGLTTFSTGGVPVSTTCAACDTNCYECIGGLPS